MRTKRTIGLLLGGILAVAAALVPAGAATAGNDPGHNPQGVKMATGAEPDECLFLRQLNPDEQKYRNVNNNFFTYDVSKFGKDWFDVACGSLAFTVPFGQQALVDLTAVAELDCQSTAAQPSDSWCGGRFLINGTELPWPNNNGRSDSYAWDSANGGTDDWQANTLAQEYVATCRDSVNQTPCTYKVQLQSRLENGATSVWIDDLTIRVDVSEGPVSVVSGSSTP